ncbi:TonB-dependent receptor [Alkalimonas sp. NCh-2]|uniref:TonB-dependent receptor domain-containing protein n=1 Tax=Alkalimonas sp. NCh-2 TaxID=3144846 RepID=UPI0031F65434
MSARSLLSRYFPLSLLSLCLAPALQAASHAGDEADIERIEVRARPGQGLTLDYAEQTAGREVRDIFANAVDISIGGGDRQGRRLFLRGAEGSNLNITVDGARQGPNLYNHRGGMLGVDPAILKQVSVTSGPATAEDGAGAMAGSIRFTTKDAQDIALAHETLAGFIRASHASAASAETLNMALAITPTEQLGILAYAGGSNAGLQRIGGGDTIPFSAYQDRNQLIKLSLLGEHQLRIGHEQNKTSGLNFQQRGDYPYQVQPPTENRPPRQQSLKRTSTHLDYGWNSGFTWLTPELNVYQQKTAWASPDNLGEAFDSKGSGVTLKNTVQWSEASRLVAGLDHLQEKGNAYGNNLPDSLGAINYRNTGAFVQAYWQWQALALTAGTRHDHYQTHYGDSKANGSLWSPNLQASWELNDAWQLFAGYGSSARGFGTIPVHFARRIQPDATAPDKAERARQQEAGLRWHWPVSASLSLASELSYFHNQLRDFILYEHGGSGGLGGRPVIAFSNQSEPIIFEGVQLTIRAQSQDWSAELGYNHTSSRHLPEQPQHRARAGTELGDKFHLRLNYQLTSDWQAGYQLTAQHGLTLTDDSRKPGYVTHNLHLNWQALPQLELTLAAQNLTDKHYISHSTLWQNGFATEEPGRDLRIALHYQF